MENIPTAEEFIKKYWECDEKFIESIKQQMSKMGGINFNNIPDLMIEFAKLHRTAILGAVKGKATIKKRYDGSIAKEYWEDIVDENSIDNAYPESNIK